MDLGQRIKEARKQAGLTQKELSEKSHIATITIQQYERGVRQPRIEKLQAISLALNMKLSQLIDMPNWPSERELLDETGEKAYHASQEAENGISEEVKEKAEKLIDEIEDLSPVSDILSEIDCDKSVRSRIDAALNKLSPEGQLIAAERVEELAKIPDYQRS